MVQPHGIAPPRSRVDRRKALHFETLEQRQLLAVDLQNWMADLPDSMRLSEVSIPGTHDTLAYGHAFQHDPTDTQDLNLLQQLNAGIRFFDIRLRKVLAGGFLRFHGHHGIVYLNVNFDEVLKVASSFLAAHPEETILMRINTKEQPAFPPPFPGLPYPSDIDLLNSYLNGSHPDMDRDVRPYLYRRPHTPAQSNLVAGGVYVPTAGVPALGDVRGKMVWFADNWGDQDPTIYPFSSIVNSTDTATYNNGGDVYDQLVSYLGEVETRSPEEFMRMGMTGQQFGVATPYGVATIVNSQASNLFANYLGLRTVGIITMDFPESDPDLIRRIIEQNGPGRGTVAPYPMNELFVNVGGPAFPDDPFVDDGNYKSWKSDVNVYLRHTATNISESAAPIDLTHPSVPAHTPEDLFKTERWDPAGDAEMQWDFPVEPGEYQVKLYFVENFFAGAGVRVFDVSIEGQTALDDYDIFADVGFRKGVVKSFIVESDENLDIDFGHVIENPTLAGIEFRKIIPGAFRANLGGRALAEGPDGEEGADWEGDKAISPYLSGANLVFDSLTRATGLVDTDAEVPYDHATRAEFTPNVTTFWNSHPVSGKWEQYDGWENDRGNGVYQMETGATSYTIDFAADPGWNVQIVSFDLLNEAGGEINVNWTIRGALSGVLASGTTHIPKSDVAKPVNPISLRTGDHGVTGEFGETVTLEIQNPFGGNNDELALDNLFFRQVEDPRPAYRHFSVPEGTPMEIFQTARYNVAESFGSLPTLERMHLDFPVVPGEYQVNLYFAEAIVAGPGRVFDVIIEGETVLDNYDIFADVGRNRGVVKRFHVTADDNLDIDLRRAFSIQPLLAGIEIIRDLGDVRIDESGDLLILEANGEDAPDAYTIKSDQANSRFVISTNPGAALTTFIPGAAGSGTNVVTVPYAAVTGSQILVNAGGGLDQLTVDLSLGGFVLPIRFHGGAGEDYLLVDDANSAFSDEFYVTGGPNAYASDQAQLIRDLATISSTLEVALTQPITDVNVTLDITHSYQSDLYAYLIGPDGTRVELFTAVGDSTANFTNTTLDDEAATSITAGSGSFTGAFRPEGSLADFDGKIPAGLWTLEIIDSAAGDIGTLNSWSLDFGEASQRIEVTNGVEVDLVDVENVSLIAAGDDTMNVGADILGDLFLGAFGSAGVVNLQGRPTTVGKRLSVVADTIHILQRVASGEGQAYRGRLVPTAAGVDIVVSPGYQLSFFGGDAVLSLAIDGAAVDSGYDQLRVLGEVNLASLALSVSGTHAPSVGEQFVLIDNDGTDPIAGQFNDLPEGAVIGNFLGSGLSARISYLGTDGATGNDVVLTVENSATPTGDFDLDQDVDGHDLLAWQRGFGMIYDASQLAGWEENFGNAFAAAIASVVAVEPSAAFRRAGLSDEDLTYLALAAASAGDGRHVGLGPSPINRPHADGLWLYPLRELRSPLESLRGPFTRRRDQGASRDLSSGETERLARQSVDRGALGASNARRIRSAALQDADAGDEATTRQLRDALVDVAFGASPDEDAH